MMTSPFLIRLRVRVAAASFVALAAFVGFFGLHPENLQHRDLGTAVGLMTFSIAVATFGGHGIYHLFRRGFLQSEELAARTRELEDLSKTLADRVAARTSELRLLAAHVQDLRESEHRTIARELHDELGQLLTGMRMELDMAERARTGGGDIGAHHATLVELLDAKLISTRSILSGLEPRILDDLGLEPALEWLAADARRRSGLDVRLTSPGDELDIEVPVARAVFRIVQEALTNALRHARAQQIRVGLRADGGGLEATIDDDGVGIPAVTDRRPGSLGLLSMRERAKSLDGAFELARSPLGGTRVTVRIPGSAFGNSATEPS